MTTRAPTPGSSGWNAARRIRDDGSEEEVSLDAIVVGDRLRVRPGEKVPVDGEVIEGRSSLDESMVTGESMAVTKEIGAKLTGATLNTTGSLVMRADKVGRDTMLARIVQMVADAQRSRAPIQRLADRVSGYSVPAVIGAAALCVLGAINYLDDENLQRGEFYALVLFATAGMGILAGAWLSVGTITVSLLPANGIASPAASPASTSFCGLVVSADRNRSAGAPCSICVSRAADESVEIVRSVPGFAAS